LVDCVEMLLVQLNSILGALKIKFIFQQESTAVDVKKLEDVL
jgi:hypothetical protein